MVVMRVPYQALTILLSTASLCSNITYHYGDGSYYIGTVGREGRPKEGVMYSKEGTRRYNGSYERGLYHGEGTWYGDRGNEYKGCAAVHPIFGPFLGKGPFMAKNFYICSLPCTPNVL